MEPSHEQQKVIDSTGRRIVVIAGPGSGKTRTLIWRIIADIARGALPAEMVCITFTNAGAKELKKRLAEHDIKLKFVGTLHAFMLSLLNGILVLNAETAEQIAKQAMEQCALKQKMPLSRFNAIKALSPAAMDAQGVQAFERIVVNVYRKMLAAMGATDYDMLLVDGLAHIISEGVRLKWLYVDEYQDSAPIDAEIYAALDPEWFFIVGDPDQSVYGFRGATMKNIMTEAAKADTVLFRLEDNYRSLKTICRAANALIAHNKERIPKTTFGVCDYEGEASALRCGSEQMERSAIIGRIIQWRKESQMEFSEIAILCRYNTTRAAVVEMLKGEGWPVADEKEAVPAERALLLASLQLLRAPDSVVLAAHWYCMTFPTADFAMTCREFVKMQANGEPVSPPMFHNTEITLPEHLAEFLAKNHVKGEAARDAVRTMRNLEIDNVPALLVALQDGYTAQESERDAITVTTYHGAKGREWKGVILPRCDQATSPAGKTGDKLEEERRLSFVAYTRARWFLLVTVAESRRNDYKPVFEPQIPSQFIREAGLLS